MDFDLSSGAAVLARTPQTLRALLTGLPSAWTAATEGPGTWSPHAVVAHLAHAERVNWIPRARVILEQGADRRFAPFDRLPTDAAAASLDTLLDEFSRLRGESLSTLVGWDLTDAELALTGEHPEFGPVALRQLLATWVAHDLAHVAQIVRTMATQYRDAVGPWQAYLRIMAPR